MYNPKKVNLYVGADLQNVGYVKLWNTNSKIYFSVKTTDDNMLEMIHSYLGLAVPTNSSPGKLGFAYDPADSINEFTFSTSYIYLNDLSAAEARTKVLFEDVNYGTKVYIAVHTEVSDSD